MLIDEDGRNRVRPIDYVTVSRWTRDYRGPALPEDLAMPRRIVERFH